MSEKFPQSNESTPSLRKRVQASLTRFVLGRRKPSYEHPHLSAGEVRTMRRIEKHGMKGVVRIPSPESGPGYDAIFDQNTTFYIPALHQNEQDDR